MSPTTPISLPHRPGALSVSWWWTMRPSRIFVIDTSILNVWTTLTLTVLLTRLCHSPLLLPECWSQEFLGQPIGLSPHPKHRRPCHLCLKSWPWAVSCKKVTSTYFETTNQMSLNPHCGKCMTSCLLYHDDAVPKDIAVSIAAIKTKYITHVVYLWLTGFCVDINYEPSIVAEGWPTYSELCARRATPWSLLRPGLAYSTDLNWYRWEMPLLTSMWVKGWRTGSSWGPWEHNWPREGLGEWGRNAYGFCWRGRRGGERQSSLSFLSALQAAFPERELSVGWQTPVICHWIVFTRQWPFPPFPSVPVTCSMMPQSKHFEKETSKWP